MQGTFAFPFALAESEYLTLARGLDAQADAMVVPENFQGRTARAFAGAQAERRATLNRLSESAYSAAQCCVHQNFADEELAAAPSPEEVATQEAKVRTMTAALDSGFGSVTAVLAAKQALAELRAQREAALDAHAAESTRTTGCFGHLDFPQVDGRRGDGGGNDDPRAETGGTPWPTEINPKNLPRGDVTPQPPPDEVPPSPDTPTSPGAPEAPITGAPAAPSVPGGTGSTGGSASEVSGGVPLVPSTGLSGGGMAAPQSPMMQMPPQMPGGGMPGAGGFGFPMPAGMPPVPGTGFTAPATGRQLAPLPRPQNRDAETTKEALDLTLFPDAAAGGIPAAAPAAVAGVGAAIAGAVTQANVTGVTPPVVSAMPPANPIGGGGTPGGPYGGGGMTPMAPMGSGAGMAGGGGSIAKREPILAADGGTVAAESLQDAVATGIIGRDTADAPKPERAA